MSPAPNSRDIRWEQTAEKTIEIRPANAGCSTTIGMALAVLGALVALLPVLQLIPLLNDPVQFDGPIVVRQTLFGLALGAIVFAAGASLVFNERRIVVDGSRGEVSFNRQLLFWRRTRRYSSNELRATGVRPHSAAAPAGATPRISHYTHDVLIYRHQGEPLLVDHAQWEHKDEALQLAAAIASALDLEQQ